MVRMKRVARPTSTANTRSSDVATITKLSRSVPTKLVAFPVARIQCTAVARMVSRMHMVTKVKVVRKHALRSNLQARFRCVRNQFLDVVMMASHKHSVRIKKVATI